MLIEIYYSYCFFFFQAEDGIRDVAVTGVQTCALPIFRPRYSLLYPIFVKRDARRQNCDTWAQGDLGGNLLGCMTREPWECSPPEFDLSPQAIRSEEHTSELQSRLHLVCRLLLEKKKQHVQA